MKIVLSSTKEQEEAIECLLLELRFSILPLYVSDQELYTYNSMGLLQFNSQRNLYNGTLKEAFHVMAALQTVISIIEDKNTYAIDKQNEYEELFNTNVALLNYYGLFFPFTFRNFKKYFIGVSSNRHYTHLSNQLLM